MNIDILVLFTFVLIHIFAGKAKFLNAIPRCKWLSFAGGISVAYIFLHLFPEMATVEDSFAQKNSFFIIKHPGYLTALLGLTLFYGMERFIKVAKAKGSRNNIDTFAFGIHISSFALYNIIVGYLLVHRQDEDTQGLLFYGLALGLHFFVNDYGLRQHHQHLYHKYGRWILAVSVVIGWAVAELLKFDEFIIHFLFAFMAGSTVLNVLKEELPDERQSRLLPFITGVCLFTALVMLYGH